MRTGEGEKGRKRIVINQLREARVKMKIFTAAQIREGDSYTIRNEPIDSIDLMERAAGKCAQWIKKNYPDAPFFYIFCGVGNNGGDGLALTRILQDLQLEAHAYIVMYSEKLSADCQINRDRLEHSFGARIHDIYQPEDFPEIPADAVIVDALFGTGLNRPLKGLVHDMVSKINSLTNTVVSIDMPSGLQAEDNTDRSNIVKATHTLSFEFYKLSFLFSENAGYTGEIHILPIGIHPDYIKDTSSPFQFSTQDIVQTILKKRDPFSHKGTYGHALIAAGSYGKIGAAVLATKAALHSGAGLVTAHVPACGYTIMQTAAPEAMCLCSGGKDYLSALEMELKPYTAIGIGPGIDTHQETRQFLKSILKKASQSLVLDADALNIISKEAALFNHLPEGAILTPHPKEFERLFGKTTNGYERLQLQIQKSKEWRIFILLKGHRTCITSPEGQVWFNTTGNAGMATGGSGDVLTGILTGLLAQGYPPGQAAVLGAWLHGKAGDIGASKASQESLTASDIIHGLGAAFKEVRKAC